MSTSRVLVGVLGTSLVAAYSIGSGVLVATDQEWYRTLTKPSWQPPGVVVGLIWPFNFTLLIVASWVVASRLSGTLQLAWLGSLALSVASALAWAWLFFDQHSLPASAAALVLASLFTVPLLLISFRASLALGFAFVPYQAWLVFATSLAFSYSTQ